MNSSLILWVATLVTGLASCAPAFNWREFIAEGSGVIATFPCRPDRHARPVVVADSRLRMEMLVCAAGGSTFALSFLDVPEPARVSFMLGELRALALANVQGVRPRLLPVQVNGMTPSPQAMRLSAPGRLPDGEPIHVHAAFFSKGLRVYQATVIGAEPAPQVVETFLGGLKFPA